ncbi:hypothetical protein KM043_001225 [Ampulex compressa]|nr:hypothetical protein KM043_001225 [Ampulex compressa]
MRALESHSTTSPFVQSATKAPIKPIKNKQKPRSDSESHSATSTLVQRAAKGPIKPQETGFPFEIAGDREYSRAILLSAFLGHGLGTPIANVWVSPIGASSPLRQYHLQDGSGSYRYSFTGPHHAKAESSLNGITQGGYSYIDANGILQTVTYTADDENGFRVRASNLPQAPRQEAISVQDSQDVAAAKRIHLDELHKSRMRDQNWRERDILSYKILPNYYSLAQFRGEAGNPEERGTGREVEEQKNPFLLESSEAQRIEVPKPDPSLSRISSSGSASQAGSQVRLSREESQASNRNSIKLVPISGVQAPLAVPRPYVLPVLPYRLVHSSLHHTQDSLGQYDYSYTGDSSAKTESRSIDGTTRGAYSYIDPNGILQQVHYIADHNGFRVMATNLPEAK